MARFITYITCHQHPPVTLLSSDQANTSSLTKTLRRFHDHQNQLQPNNEYGTRRIRHNRRTKAKATSKDTMIPFRPSLWLQSPLFGINAVKTVALYQFPRPADHKKQPGIEPHWAFGGGRNDSTARYVALWTQSPDRTLTA